MSGDVVFRHSKLYLAYSYRTFSIQQIQFIKIVRIVRFRIDPFAIALFGFVTSAKRHELTEKRNEFLNCFLTRGPITYLCTRALSTLATPLHERHENGAHPI